MKNLLAVAVLAALALTVPAFADSKIKIDTVPAEYTPYLSIAHEPVSLHGYHFEVNEETGRARLVANYTYAENMIAGADDGGGIRSAVVQLPELTYDAGNHAVVYTSNGSRTVCAVVQESKGFWGRHSRLKNTGACTVSTAPANVTADDGWDIHHLQVLNTYLEVKDASR